MIISSRIYKSFYRIPLTKPQPQPSDLTLYHWAPTQTLSHWHVPSLTIRPWSRLSAPAISHFLKIYLRPHHHSSHSTQRSPFPELRGLFTPFCYPLQSGIQWPYENYLLNNHTLEIPNIRIIFLEIFLILKAINSKFENIPLLPIPSNM